MSGPAGSRVPVMSPRSVFQLCFLPLLIPFSARPPVHIHPPIPSRSPAILLPMAMPAGLLLMGNYGLGPVLASKTDRRVPHILTFYCKRPGSVAKWCDSQSRLKSRVTLGEAHNLSVPQFAPL